MRLLVVEDEAPLSQQLKTALTEAGYSVDTAMDGEEGLFYALEHPYDVAIIDLGLPKKSGVEVIRSLREQERTYPVLVLTARSNWKDKVEALDSGADDYVVKPFHIQEVLARLNALVRRSSGHASPTVQYGPFELNTATQTLQVSGREVDLTAYEYKLIEYLMLHPRKIVSKTELTEHIYDQDFDRDSNVIEVFVGRLRKKLDPTGELKPIETLRGRGYRFTSQEN